MQLVRLVTPEDFEPWVGRMVRLNTAPRPVEILLARLQRLPPIVGADFREPFELIFETPWQVVLADDNYECDCGHGGPYFIHLSQILPRKQTRRYQALFA
ncbi:DUF6916 family protein [Sphingomonas sp. R1]|uniref:DUF6916 family protein n=1 Tax=Sphingomonas sp. R1 TaxID=399176 RepID=UPI00222467B4|nr:hypothetical protein [Sphingomonas sp. R1]UYY77082.1 hypothetical protein OIM94_16535 [Sphingomonas sp. R1]